MKYTVLGRSIMMVVALPLAFWLGTPLRAQQNPFEKELDRLDWQPTWEITGAQYVGSETCAQCHLAEASDQKSSAMARALSRPGDSEVLEQNPRLTFNNGPYQYTVERSGNAISYSVTDGAKAISVPVSWAFGYGVDEVGQTYVFSYQGSYYESRVSFFSGGQGLGITLGHSPAVPSSLPNALGRAVEPEELRACFGCHSTAAVSDGRLQIDKLVPGVTCEGCHGPGAEHVAAMKAGKIQPNHIFNPGTLRPGDLIKFCGACHRTRRHVEAMGVKGVLTVRFQPYRLASSRCYNAADSRISCLACHNPHQNTQHEPAFYDAKCLACHSSTKTAARSSKQTAAACPVARSRCVTCHMPRYKLPGSSFKFTDHRIRVVRLGDAFD